LGKENISPVKQQMGFKPVTSWSLVEFFNYSVTSACKPISYIY